jgi:hypothetical protein
MKISVSVQDRNTSLLGTLLLPYSPLFFVCLPYGVLFVLFCADFTQFFMYTHYQIPLVIIYYCIALPRVSYIHLVWALFLIALASVYTHDLFGAQLLPLIPITLITPWIKHFIYRKSLMPYIALGSFILCEAITELYIWHTTIYAKDITFLKIAALASCIWCITTFLKKF